MIDIKRLRENPALFKTTCINKGCNVDIDVLLQLDAEVKEVRQALQAFATQKNQAGKTIAQCKDNDQRQQLLVEMSTLKDKEKAATETLETLGPKLDEMLLHVPQPPHPDCPIGTDESGNVVTRQHGEIPTFDFELKDHMTLGHDLGIVDTERGVKISGSRSYILRGDGALLHQAVLRLAHDTMVKKGFEPLTVPVMTREETFTGTGWFPEGKPQVYNITEDNLYLVGTAEVPAMSMYMGEILEEADLPIKMVAQSNCFRREAGAAGKDTHGLYRIHQFEKVEQVVICKNDIEETNKLHEEIVDNSEAVLQALGLPYQVLEICTGDMGSGKYRMYDLETYMPSRNGYCETHSASNLLDYQTRRLGIRYRDKDRKTHYCYSLNNTVAASPRILIAILELNQNKDGSINIPEVLQPYMHGKTKITKKQ